MLPAGCNKALKLTCNSTPQYVGAFECLPTVPGHLDTFLLRLLSANIGQLHLRLGSACSALDRVPPGMADLSAFSARCLPASCLSFSSLHSQASLLCRLLQLSKFIGVMIWLQRPMRLLCEKALRC